MANPHRLPAFHPSLIHHLAIHIVIAIRGIFRYITIYLHGSSVPQALDTLYHFAWITSVPPHFHDGKKSLRRHIFQYCGECMEDVILFGVMCQVQSHSPCFRRNLQDIHMSQAASVVHLVGEGDMRCGNQFSILRTRNYRLWRHTYAIERLPLWCCQKCY